MSYCSAKRFGYSRLKLETKTNDNSDDWRIGAESWEAQEKNALK
jgi:hypothetical protein